MLTVKQILVYGLILTAWSAYGQSRTRTVITPYGSVNIKVYNGEYVYQTKAISDTSLELINSLIDTPSMKAKNSKLPAVGFLSIYSPATRPHIFNTFDLIRHNSRFGFIGAVLIDSDGTRMGISNRITVMLKPTTTTKMFKAILSTVKTDSIIQSRYRDRKNWFTIYINKFNKDDALNVANMLNQSKLFHYADVVWIRVEKLQGLNGSQKGQWGIRNDGSIPNSKARADMDVTDAWGLATGKNIRVAVLDDGVDLDHPDLKVNLEPGYDATRLRGTGAPSTDDGHGTECAGIISAANNDIGTVGIAYDARLIPVKIGFENHTTGELILADDLVADGIHWAVENGHADILSCSWIGGVASGNTINELNQAMLPKPGHRGAIIVFAAGNQGAPYLLFPANVPGVVAVGASNMCDTRQNGRQCDDETWASNYGSRLAVLAPGVQICTTTLHYGHEDPYTMGFSGTSAACPQVAGVFALMLQANPRLTAAQAIQLLETNADEVSSYPYEADNSHPAGKWCAESGYGRVNAFRAVTAAKAFVAPATQMQLRVLRQNFIKKQRKIKTSSK